MLKYYLINIINMLKITGLLSLVINLIFIGIIGFIIYSFHKIFKNFPYSFLDQILSQVLIIVPYFITYYIGENRSLLTIAAHLLLINIAMLPILGYLKNYRWSADEKGEVNLFTWKSPLVYYDLNITIIYTYIFLIYIMILRLCSLKANIDLSFIFCMESVPVIILTLCYIPVIIYILLKIKDLKEYLWSRSNNLLYSSHLAFLQKKIYLKFYLFFQKHIFTLVHFCFCDHIKQGKLSKILSVLFTVAYRKPLVFFFLTIFFGVIEVLITKHLHYFFSILFLYFLLYTISNFFFQIYNKNIILEICTSDYLYKNWKNPHFPAPFWYIFDDNMDALMWFGFLWEHTEEELKYFYEQRKKYNRQEVDKYRFLSPYADRLEKKILQNPRLSWLGKVAFDYRRYQYGVRYVHTGTGNQFKESIQAGLKAAQKSPTPLPPNMHNGVPYLITNELHQAYLLNEKWAFYDTFNSPIMRKQKYSLNIYVSNAAVDNFTKEPRMFSNWIEYNTPTHFAAVEREYNIKFRVGTPDLVQKLLFKTQALPDVIMDASEATIDCGQHAYVGLDLKVIKRPGCAFNTILSSSREKYTAAIKNYMEDLNRKKLLTAENNEVLNELIRSCDNPEKHSLIYVQNMKLFPPTLPPIRVEQSFCTRELTKEAVDTYGKGKAMAYIGHSIVTSQGIPPLEKNQITGSIINLSKNPDLWRDVLEVIQNMPVV